MYYAYCMCIVVCVSVGKYRIVGSWLLYGVATSTLFVGAIIRDYRVDALGILYYGSITKSVYAQRIIE